LLPQGATLVLFSGGRDSSLAACLEANAGRDLLLMTAKTGATIATDVVSSRVEEIRSAFPSVSIEWYQPHSAGIFRRIAIANIESDFAKYKTNLILLGHQMAIQCEGIAVALKRGIKRVISGFSGYQADEYMEQMPVAISISKRLFKAYDLTFETPIVKYDSLDQVKFQLLDFGVTTKSLEAVSLFADSFSAPAKGAVEEYMVSKIPTCTAYIKLKTGIEAALSI
jgi:7-cyano-7-deazaguanine synthase in queuosine biosynthesis